MLQYTQEEKQQAKAAKKAFKVRQHNDKVTLESYDKKALDEKKPIITDGILDEEYELLDSHPVYGSFYYVADGKLISSAINGTVKTLKADLKKRNISANKIYKANLVLRNII